MLLITHQLAQRLEMAEAEDGVACVEAQRLLNPGAGAISEPFLGGYLLYAGADSPFTHALGLGLSGSVKEADIEHMEAFYHSREAGITVEVSPYADSTLLETLSRRSYKAKEFVTVLARQLSASEPMESVATARLAEASESALYADTVVIPGTLAYFGIVDGVSASCGQMAFHSGVATCFGDSTLTAYRRRGAHAAVIRARIAEAASEGCELITAGTQPGSISQRDFERQGFQVAYTKVTMVLE